MKSALEVKYLRDKHGLTQEQLASLIGVSYTTVNAWESGKRKPQHAMKELLLKLHECDTVQNISVELDQNKSGIARTDAGFVSSLISYNGKKDNNALTHGIGRWYGCLPSMLVSDLVRFCSTDLSANGEVLVNYCGSGTAALEFARAGFLTHGIDINPAALFLSYTKTQKIKPLDGLKLDNYLDFIKSRNTDDLTFSGDKKNLLANDDKWISNESKKLFAKVIGFINELKDFNEQVVLTLALLNISVDYCQIDKRCTNHYVFKKNDISEVEFYKDLRKEVDSLNEKLSALLSLDDYTAPSLTLQNNQETNYSDDKFDIVFSHPPYGTTINYYSISRVHQSIIENIKFVDQDFDNEIHKGMLETQKDDQSSSTLNKFYQTIPLWVSESKRVLKAGGHLVVVIGDSRDKGYLSHPHTEIINHAESMGFKLKELFIWVTENKTGMHIRRKGHHIDHNYILVLENKNVNN